MTDATSGGSDTAPEGVVSDHATGSGVPATDSTSTDSTSPDSTSPEAVAAHSDSTSPAARRALRPELPVEPDSPSLEVHAPDGEPMDKTSASANANEGWPGEPVAPPSSTLSDGAAPAGDDTPELKVAQTLHAPDHQEPPKVSTPGHYRPKSASQRALSRGAFAGAVLILATSLGTAGGYFAGATRAGGGDSAASRVVIDRTPQTTQVAADWVATVSATVQPTVVSVIASRNGQPFSTGSGVVLTEDGHIMTNAHVVDGATDVTIRLSDATTLPAVISGADSIYDIAVVKVAEALPPAVFNTDPVVVGEPVAAFGAPLGLYGTVTVGIVSAVARPVTAGNGSGETSIISAIQTDAAVNPGNSGGPLVNVDGEVVGVNSSIATLSGGPGGGSIGLGFAIPSSTAVRVATELADTGTAARPLIGVSIGPASPYGARIDALTPGGPAEKAGILVGDVVMAVDGSTTESPVAAIALIRNATPGATVRLTIQRNGVTEDVDVTTIAESGPLRPVTPTPSPTPSAPTPPVPVPVPAPTTPPAPAPTR